MKTNSAYQGKLAFLNDFVEDKLNQYQTASWLRSYYKDHKWTCTFGTFTCVLDFRVLLDDSSLLTDPKNEVLLNTLKSWLCVQGHPSLTGYRVNAPVTTRAHFAVVLHVIDYFLINARRFGLAKYGLQTLTADDIKEFLHDLATGSTIEFSIYKWDQRLTEFLKAGGETISDEELDLCLKNNPQCGEFRDVLAPILALDKTQLLKARVYLWKNGFYEMRARKLDDYRYRPNLKTLCEAIYSETIGGCHPIDTPEELCFGWAQSYARELDGVPVKNYEGNFRSLESLRMYVAAIRSLGLLTSANLPVPHWALEATADQAFLQSLPTRNSGRYKTLPYEVVSRSLKDSIEFVLKYGSSLVDTYLNIAKATKESHLASLSVFTTGKDITQYLTPTLREMGVRYWSLQYHMLCVEKGDTFNNPKAKPPTSEFFSRFRSNQGLYELLEVLYGSVQVCVGTLMARRQGEFNDLEADDALDISNSFLIFKNRKTGAYGRQVTTARPIPNIGVEAIKLLQRLQDGLVDLGVEDGHGKLFAMPSCGRLDLSKNADSSRYLDRFCDYFELPADPQGRRYYVRQHQLRRNFAMAFFWGASFGGIETLQWFLGQADPEHLYNYITEAMPGKSLTYVKAAHAAYLLVRDRPEVSELSDVAEKHFGTRDFSVLDYDELQEYIADLLEENKVTVEPQFFKVAKSKQYRILVLVKEPQ